MYGIKKKKNFQKKETKVFDIAPKTLYLSQAVIARLRGLKWSVPSSMYQISS